MEISIQSLELVSRDMARLNELIAGFDPWVKVDGVRLIASLDGLYCYREDGDGRLLRLGAVAVGGDGPLYPTFDASEPPKSSPVEVPDGPIFGRDRIEPLRKEFANGLLTKYLASVAVDRESLQFTRKRRTAGGGPAALRPRRRKREKPLRVIRRVVAREVLGFRRGDPVPRFFTPLQGFYVTYRTAKGSVRVVIVEATPHGEE